MTFQPFSISRGGRPRTPCDATRGVKQMGEVNRVLPGSHKSAEPIEAGRAGTSGPVHGSACEPAMARATEPMADASLLDVSRQPGSGRGDLRTKTQFGGALIRAEPTRIGDERNSARQPRRVLAWRQGRIPHGVESAPKAGERSEAEPKNLVIASASFGRQMAEATSERDDRGRSLRSSPRAGKPPTWRREAVDTACRQEVDICPTR